MIPRSAVVAHIAATLIASEGVARDFYAPLWVQWADDLLKEAERREVEDIQKESQLRSEATPKNHSTETTP